MINPNITFQEALDIVESFSDHQQENLFKIVRHRILERKRDILAENVKKAKVEYQRNDVAIGSVDDLMKELTE